MTSLQTAFDLVKNAPTPDTTKRVTTSRLDKQDTFGLLPLHHAITNAEEQPKMDEYFEKTKNITAKTCSGLSVAHYAVTAKNQLALDAIAGHKKKSELLLSQTLEGLTPLHIAFLNRDYETARFLIQKEPKALMKADANGLTPTQILLYHVLTHAEHAEEKTGPIHNSELALLALHVALPFLEAYTPKEAQMPLTIALFSAEHGQSNDPYSAIFAGALDAAISSRTPTPGMELSLSLEGAKALFFKSYQGLIGLFFTGRRIQSVASTTFTPLKRSWNYSSYEPATGIKRTIVHLSTLGLSTGRAAYRLLFG